MVSKLKKFEKRGQKHSAVQRVNQANLSQSQKTLLAYLSDKSTSSHIVLMSSLRVLAQMVDPDADIATFPWHELRYEHTSMLRLLLAQQVELGERSATTVNRHIAALRGMLKCSWRLGYMNAEDYQRATDIKVVKHEMLPAGRVIEKDEQNRIWRHCLQDCSPRGLRNLALLVMLRTGARRQEIADLDLKDIDLSDGSVKIRSGKGSKARITYFPIELAPILKGWLVMRGDKAGPLLNRVRSGGKIIKGSRMRPNSFFWILRQIQEELNLKPLTPHDFRRTFITELADAGIDVATSQRLAGHADPKTHMRYDRRGEKAKKSAIKALHVPIFGATN